MMTELASRPATPAKDTDAFVEAVKEARVSAGAVNVTVAEIMTVLHDHHWIGFSEDDVRNAMALHSSQGVVAWPAPGA